MPLELRGGIDPDDGQATQLAAAISDLELGLRHEGFGKFGTDPDDPAYRLSWRCSGRVEVTTFSDSAESPAVGVTVLIVSRCAQFDPAAVGDVVTWLRTRAPLPADGVPLPATSGSPAPTSPSSAEAN